LAYFTIHKDFTHSSEGMYQLAGVSIEINDEEQDVTEEVDLGYHFHEENPNELLEYLSKTFEVPVSDIEIEAV